MNLKYSAFWVCVCHSRDQNDKISIRLVASFRRKSQKTFRSGSKKKFNLKNFWNFFDRYFLKKSWLLFLNRYFVCRTDNSKNRTSIFTDVPKNDSIFIAMTQISEIISRINERISRNKPQTKEHNALLLKTTLFMCFFLHATAIKLYVALIVEIVAISA